LQILEDIGVDDSAGFAHAFALSFGVWADHGITRRARGDGVIYILYCVVRATVY
jgi:hypothetical protein